MTDAPNKTKNQNGNKKWHLKIKVESNNIEGNDFDVCEFVCFQNHDGIISTSYILHNSAPCKMSHPMNFDISQNIFSSFVVGRSHYSLHSIPTT